MILLILLFSTILITAIIPSIPQNPNYHYFADNRMILGIPNFWNVSSNVIFIIIGVKGMLFLISTRNYKNNLSSDSEKYLYYIFFISLCLSGLGSIYYHLQPNNMRLFWDRLGIALCSASYFSIALSEWIDVRLGIFFSIFVILLGIFSVVYRNVTELLNQCDLRLYGFIQFFPYAFIIVMFFLFRSSYTKIGYIKAALITAMMARIFEITDWFVFKITFGLLGGHILKHIFASFSCYFLLRYLKERKRVN